MLKGLVEFSLRFRGIVVALGVVAVAYGVSVATRSKLDVFPEFAPPQVFIQTEAPGLSAEQVEALVTRPVENGVNGVGSLETIRSQSIQGLSVVLAIFREGTEILRARQMVSERLVQIAGDLPQGVRQPRMMPLTSSTSLILMIGLTSQKRSQMELRTFADWTVRPRLLGVPGVASVVTFGGEVRQLQVQLLTDRLIAYELGANDVLAAARSATGVLGAGFVETSAQRIPIRTEGQSLTPAQLGEVVVARQETGLVRLRDVARVAEGPEPKLGDGLVQGEPGVMLQIWSQYGSNTLDVTEALDRALEELAPAFQSEGVRLDRDIFRPAKFIETSVQNVNRSLLLGGAFVAVVLTLFLWNLRTAFISLTAIPLSLLIAVIILDHFGVSLNTLTLGGFAIAIGEVVDDSIIDVENIYRRLKENQAKGSPKSSFQVVLEASLEVRTAVVYATFVVALVFLPVLTMSGVQGKLFAPLGIAYILATLASLAVALTVTPALSLLMLSRVKAKEEPRGIRWLKRLHHGILVRLGKRPGSLIALALILCLGAAATVPFFGGEFLPEFQEGHFIVQMWALPGTSAPESMRIGREISRALLGSQYVRSVAQATGRAELGEDTTGTDFSEFNVSLKPLDDEDEAEAAKFEIRTILSKFPGVKFAVKTFLVERIEETISGVKADLAVKVYGNDLAVLDDKAAEIERILAAIPGRADVQFLRSEEPQLIVRLLPDRLKEFNFRPMEVMEAVQTAYQGILVGQTFEGNRVFDVEVLLDPEARQDPERLRSLLLRNPEGTPVSLGMLADVYLGTGRHVIQHDGARRFQEVSSNIRGRDQASFVREVRQRIDTEVQFPPGVYYTLGGAAEAQAGAQREILLHSALAGVGVVLLLAIVFRRARNLILVLANVPFALVGGVLAVFMLGGSLSVGSLVGFVTLFGITTRNSIMMISHYEYLVAVEGETWCLATALRGASERLVPVLMTAIVTALGA
ncbi:MAG TPA: efflux RND transporter permease subunit, partial [Planctomycetota bacterium]|nr:efflux RND transporter permease subunit [Planctomycetota bacterium]